MLDSAAHKVTKDHRSRRACLYVRQSSPQQVLRNTESARRQYDLRQRAVALGWPDQFIDTIDEDQGISGAHSANRSGFRDLLQRVAVGDVGIVLSLEVSRLCRNNTDWHRLLHYAALTDTLILDEYGVYDPKNSNDRLLLGLKGALSEYELQGIRDRMIGGQRSKAARGELKLPLPTGLVYTPTDEVVLDPDQSVREAIALVFKTFRRLGTLTQTARWFHRHKVLLPIRRKIDPKTVCWTLPDVSHIGSIIRNPRYAGCYAYGRTASRRRPDGTKQHVTVPMEEWLACLPEAHPGYIDWKEYCRNLDKLRENRRHFAPGPHRQASPREGPALLQSRMICGLCGAKMSVSYAKPGTDQVKWYYNCREDYKRHGIRYCQSILGGPIDARCADFIVGAVNRQHIALTLALREQLQADFATSDRQQTQRIDAIRYQADKARTRFMAVDAQNRLVAATLEAEWNGRLSALHKAQREQEKRRAEHRKAIDSSQDAHILKLAQDFQRVWHAAATKNKDRKRMLRLLIEDVTLRRENYQAHISVRLRGGKTHTLPPAALPQPRAYIERRDASEEALAALNQLLDSGLSERQAAVELNRLGHLDSRGDPFTEWCIRSIRIRNNIPSASQRQRSKLREQGFLSATELANQIGITPYKLRRYAPSHSGIAIHRFKVGLRNYAMFKVVPAGTLPASLLADFPSI